MATDLRERLSNTAFAFRGYNVENLGRTKELLEHRVFGSVMAEQLSEASRICSDCLHEEVNLIDHVRSGRPSTPEVFPIDMALIAAVELAHVRLLEQFFDISYFKAKFALGYSLGEVVALIASGVYRLEDILPAPLSLARECAELAQDTTMGVLFSRGPALSFHEVERLCLLINSEGQGVISISSYLSPNTVLLLGQGKTLEMFSERMHDTLPEKVHLRKNSHTWPPLHTPILWQRGVPNRAAVMQHTMGGGFTTPKPPIISCVTGKMSYNDFNSREILNRWIDHPQKLWDVLYETLASGVDLIIHVGPTPNLIPATFKRLSDNVTGQLKRRSLNSFGLRAMSGIARKRPWLTNLISSKSAILRAPFIEHIVLEDWLLAQELP
ncbi:MAG: hypothetical protein K1X74_08270 [Pirellulales bacterium]|nr:hypothetical protein [Pirellulales bacterium]